MDCRRSETRSPSAARSKPRPRPSSHPRLPTRELWRSSSSGSITTRPRPRRCARRRVCRSDRRAPRSCWSSCCAATWPRSDTATCSASSSPAACAADPTARRFVACCPRSWTSSGTSSQALLVTNSHVDRLEATGTVTSEDARRLSLVGPVARASGLPVDVRRDHPVEVDDQPAPLSIEPPERRRARPPERDGRRGRGGRAADRRAPRPRWRWARAGRARAPATDLGGQSQPAVRRWRGSRSTTTAGFGTRACARRRSATGGRLTTRRVRRTCSRTSRSSRPASG